MSTLNDSAYNVTTLAALTGMPKTTAAAWIRCEGQGTPNPTNPLNIRYWGYSTQLLGPGANGSSGVGFARYTSALAGLTDAARMIATSGNYTGIRNAIATRDAVKVAQAIEASPWAGGHYGGGAGKAGCIVRGVNGGAAPSSGGSVGTGVTVSAGGRTVADLFSAVSPTHLLTAADIEMILGELTVSGPTDPIIASQRAYYTKYIGQPINKVPVSSASKFGGDSSLGALVPADLLGSLFAWLPGFAVNAGVLVLVVVLGYGGFRRILS